MNDKAMVGWIEQRDVLLIPSDAKVSMSILTENLENHPTSSRAFARVDLDPVSGLRPLGALINSRIVCLRIRHIYRLSLREGPSKREASLSDYGRIRIALLLGSAVADWPRVTVT